MTQMLCEKRNSNHRITFQSFDNGNWYRYEYDENDNMVYKETSGLYWCRYEYDANNKQRSERTSGSVLYVWDNNKCISRKQINFKYPWVGLVL